MELTFEKWQGCRNDFVVTWVADSDGDVVVGSLRRQAATLCDRHVGIGADGLLVLRTKQRGDVLPYALTIINSDGSLANNCGNGLRCAANSILRAHRQADKPVPEEVELAVEGQVKTCRFGHKVGEYPMVEVAMGVPKLNDDVPWFKAAVADVTRLAKDCGLPLQGLEVGVCDLGNPHVVITSEHASRETMLKIGPALQHASTWDGINVHLVKAKALTNRDRARAGQELGHPVSELFEVFVWERGAGETMACGSGACAVAALALQSGLIARTEQVVVDMPGGRLYLGHKEAAAPVLMTGPAVFVFEGKLPI